MVTDVSDRSTTSKCLDTDHQDFQVDRVGFSATGKWLMALSSSAGLHDLTMWTSDRTVVLSDTAALPVFSPDDTYVAWWDGQTATIAEASNVQSDGAGSFRAVKNLTPIRFRGTGKDTAIIGVSEQQLISVRLRDGARTTVLDAVSGRTIVGATDGDRKIIGTPDGSVYVEPDLSDLLLHRVGEGGPPRALKLRRFEHRPFMSDVDPIDWLVVDDREGWFDGTATAMREIGWSSADAVGTRPVDVLFDDFYYPGLLASVVAGQRMPSVPDVAARIRLPALRSLLRTKLASYGVSGGVQVLCVLPAAVPTAGKPHGLGQFGEGDFRPLKAVPNDPDCPFQVDLEGLGSSLPKADAESGLATTAWDGLADKTPSGVLQVQAIGIDTYDDPSFQPLVRSASAARRVTDAFRSVWRAGSRDVNLWAPLINTSATKDAIVNRLGELARTAGPDDTVLLFFSGHGVVPAGEEMFYYIPADFHGSRVADLSTGAVSATVLADFVRHFARID